MATFAWQQNGLSQGNEDDDLRKLLWSSEATARESTRPQQLTANSKISRVVEYLDEHGRTAAVSEIQVERKLGFSLSSPEPLVVGLKNHRNILLETRSDGARWYAYQSGHPKVRDRASLLAELEEYPNGIPMKDLADAYHGVQSDMANAVFSGDVLAVTNRKLTGENTEILFPRGLRLFFRVGGEAAGFSLSGNNRLSTAKDIRHEIRRGDAVKVTPCDEVAGVKTPASAAGRISTRMQGRLRKWARPISVSSLKEMGGDDTTSVEWANPFTSNSVPVEFGQPIPSGQVQLQKFGCTNDVRALWTETAVSLPKTDQELFKALEDHGAGVKQATHKRARPREKQKKVQRRRRMNITNRHL